MVDGASIFVLFLRRNHERDNLSNGGELYRGIRCFRRDSGVPTKYPRELAEFFFSTFP